MRGDRCTGLSGRRTVPDVLKMKRAILIVLILFFVAWDGFWWIMGVPPLTPWRLEGMLDSSTSRPILLDVRTPLEYGWFHIADAIPASGLLVGAEIRGMPEKNRPVVVICMTGHRSVLAAYKLKKRGFQEVHNLTWGMLGWVLTGGPTVWGNGTSEEKNVSAETR